MKLCLMFITNDPVAAREAVDAGVDRIMIDLETIGKEERQQGRSTVISGHALDNISAVREALPGAEILVRTNPFHTGLALEVEESLRRGADVLMLPLFRTEQEVIKYVALVDGRARICLLVETPQAMARLPLILAVPGLDEIMIGLNDLHLGLGLQFMFECVAGGLVEHMANQITKAGIRFGFGGIARLGEGLVPAELVLSEHIRLGSSMVILSRSFHDSIECGLSKEIAKLRAEERRLRSLPHRALMENRDEFARRVWRVARSPVDS